MSRMNTSPHPPLFDEVGIIALVPDRWGPSWQARHQIATRLARYFQVVWVDRPLTWRESVRWFGRRSRVWQPREAPAGFRGYCPGPLTPNLGRPAWLRRMLSQKRLQQAQRLLRERGCSKIGLYLLRHDLGAYNAQTLPV